MPNWCHNKLIVAGPKPEVEKFIVDVQHENHGKSVPSKDASGSPVLTTVNQPLSFDRVTPLPESEKENWYDWRVDNWGTKWDAVSCEIHVTTSDENKASAAYSFDTAWSPPDVVVSKLIESYPALYFKFTYGEPGMNYGGGIIGQGGHVVAEIEDVDVRFFLDERDMWF